MNELSGMVLGYLLAAADGTDLTKAEGQHHVLLLRQMGLIDADARPTRIGAMFADAVITFAQRKLQEFGTR